MMVARTNPHAAFDSATLAQHRCPTAHAKGVLHSQRTKPVGHVNEPHVDGVVDDAGAWQQFSPLSHRALPPSVSARGHVTSPPVALGGGGSVGVGPHASAPSPASPLVASEEPPVSASTSVASTLDSKASPFRESVAGETSVAGVAE